MFRVPFACLAALVAVSTAVADTDVETPLAAVPADALFVGRLASPEATLESAHAFLRAAEFLPKRSNDPFAAIGTWIGNPRLAGVDRSANWWFAGLVDADGRYSTVFLIPTTSFVEARRTLEATLGRSRVHRSGRWIVYSTDEAAVLQVRNTMDGKQESLDDSLGKAERELLLEGEVTVRVSPAAAARLPVPDDLALPVPPEWLERIGLEMSAATDPKALVKMVNANVRSLTLAVRVSPGGLGLELLLDPAGDRIVSLVSGWQAPTRSEWSTRLPEEQLVYLGLQGVPSSAVRGIVENAVEEMPRRSELRRRLAGIGETLGEIELGEVAVSVGLGRVEQGALQVAKVVAVDPADKVLELMRREYESTAFDAFETAQRVRVETGGATVAGRRADRLRVSVRREGVGRAWFDTLYGRDGLEGALLAEEGRVVQVMGGGRAFADSCLRRLDDRTGRTGNRVLAASLGRLPENANLVLLADLPSLAVGVLRAGLRGGAVEEELDPRLLDEFDRERNYTGMAVGLEPAGLRVAVHVPAVQIRRTRTVLGFLASRVRLGGS